ncbi:hypothetical protein LXA43DRAFT_138160 [Ganoderma leucocontextum]|nr:hypothetical protein LXA43DRAFT_138160 [Ganoderma leucocontextum]
MSETATWLACLREASPDHRYNSPFGPVPESLSTSLSRLPFSPGFVVCCLTFVFFGLSLVLFAICTGLVDIDLRLEDTYIRYILFLERLCNGALKMVDATGELFLVTPSRIGSLVMDTTVAFSRVAYRIPSSTLLLLDQRIRLPYRHEESTSSLVSLTLRRARLAIQARGLTISTSGKLAEHLCRMSFHAAELSAVESARTCFLLGARWIYARGRSLHAVICAGATHAFAIAVRLPSQRAYSRAWSGAMRPRLERPMPHQPATDTKPTEPHAIRAFGGQIYVPGQPCLDQLYHGEAVLTLCAHRYSKSPAPSPDNDAHAEVSFDITLELDVDGDRQSRVKFVTHGPMQLPTITAQVLRDAETQTEDQDPKAEQREVQTELEANVGVPLAGGPEGVGAHESMISLALSAGMHTTSSTSSHVSASPAQMFTFKFNPRAPSFSPGLPVSPPSAKIANGRCDRSVSADGVPTSTPIPSVTRLNPLAEEFKVPAQVPALVANLNAPDFRAGDLVLAPSHSESASDLLADLSPLSLDALTFAPATLCSGEAMTDGGGRNGEMEVRG